MTKKLHRLLAAGAVSLMLLGVSITGLAAQTGTITYESINVRAEANSSSNWVASLKQGTTVDVIGSDQDSSGATWYNISFNQDGTQLTGWVRSDLMSVTETQEPEEEATVEAPAEEEPTETPGTVGDYTIQEPTESYSGAASLSQTTVAVGDSTFTAYQTGDSQLYLVWASNAEGTTGWYWYDADEGTMQKDDGQFGQAGLVSALQSELTQAKETSSAALQTRLYILVGLGILGVILLILVIVLAVKLHRAHDDYDYDEEDDEDDDLYGGEDSDDLEAGDGNYDEDYDEADDVNYDDEDGEYEPESRASESSAASAMSWMSDSFEDFMRDVERNRDRSYETSQDSQPLPEIDMSPVTDVEDQAVAGKNAREASLAAAAQPAAQTAAQTTVQPAAQAAAQEEEPEDFDIEILDLDDLGL